MHMKTSVHDKHKREKVFSAITTEKYQYKALLKCDPFEK
jgi:hypothetical protein